MPYNLKKNDYILYVPTMNDERGVFVLDQIAEENKFPYSFTVGLKNSGSVDGTNYFDDILGSGSASEVFSDYDRLVLETSEGNELVVNVNSPEIHAALTLLMNKSATISELEIDILSPLEAIGFEKEAYTSHNEDESEISTTLTYTRVGENIEVIKMSQETQEFIAVLYIENEGVNEVVPMPLSAELTKAILSEISHLEYREWRK